MDIRFKCEKCGQHITATDDMIGQSFACPNARCRANITVPPASTLTPEPPKPRNDISFLCPACRQRLIVDGTAGGMQLACPKCGKMVIVPTLVAPAAPPAASPAMPRAPQAPMPVAPPVQPPAWTPPPPPPPVPRPVAPAQPQVVLQAQTVFQPQPMPGAPPPMAPSGAPPPVATAGAGPSWGFIGAFFGRALNDYGKRMGLVWGSALLFVLVMPVFAPTGKSVRMVLPTWEVLTSSGLSVTAKLLALCPLLVGAGMIVLGLVTRGWARAWGLLGLGLLPWLIALATPERGQVGLLLDFGAGGGMFGFVVLLGLLMYAGLRIQEATPGDLLGRLLAGVCGALMLLMMLLPLLQEPFGLLLVFPFQLMNHVNVFTGLIMLATVLALAGVSVLACLGFAPVFAQKRWLPSLCLWILWGVMAAAPVLLRVGGMWRHLRGPSVVLVPVSIGVRTELLVYGLLAATLAGLLELYAAATARGFSLAKLFGAMSAAPAPAAGTLPEQRMGMDEVKARLKELDALRRDGLISDADYEVKKQELLNRI